MQIKTLKELSHHVGEHVNVVTKDGHEGVCVVIKNRDHWGLASDDEAFDKCRCFWRVTSDFDSAFKPFKFGHYFNLPKQLTEELKSVSTIRKTRSDKGKKRAHYTRKVVEHIEDDASELLQYVTGGWIALKDKTFTVNGITLTFKESALCSDCLHIDSSYERIHDWSITDTEDYCFALYRLGLIPHDSSWIYTTEAEAEELYKKYHTAPTVEELVQDRKPLPKQVEPVFNPTFAVKSGMDLEYYLKEIIITLKEIKEKI